MVTRFMLLGVIGFIYPTRARLRIIWLYNRLLADQLQNQENDKDDSSSNGEDDDDDQTE